MKLTAIILFVGCLMVGLKGEAQTVTLSVKDAKLESVLKQFKKQTRYSFFYNESIFSKAARVTLNLKDAPVSTALGDCFGQQPRLGYSLVGNTVVISEKTVPLTITEQTMLISTQPASGITVTGTVYNKRYEALANASIMVRGTQKGTLTRADGSFKLEHLKPEDVLKVSFIGYKPTDAPIKDQPALLIILEEATNELDEVVAQGYSKTTQRLSTSSVNKVTSAEIARQPVMNPLMALQGKVPGLVVTPLTGYAAGPITMQIRGKALLSGASGSPLIVIDGTPLNVSSGTHAALGDGPVQGLSAFISPAYGQSPLFGLNPRDIESIEILKDVGATSIYGSTGANGVILITTKRGKPGNSQVDMSINTGINVITRNWKMLNTPQYLEMRREAFKNDGVIPSPLNAPDLFVWDTTRNVDWQKEIWGNTGKTLNASVSISGGVPQFTHRIAANYNRSESITQASGSDEAMGIALTLDRKSVDQKFSAVLSVNYNYTQANMIRSPNVSKLPPNAPPVFDENGNLNYAPWNAAGLESIFASFESLLKPIDSRTSSIFSNLRLTYQLLKGFSIITSIGYSGSTNNSMMRDPIISQNPKNNPTGYSIFGKSQNRTWIMEPQLNYVTWVLGQGKMNIVAGATIKQERRESMSAFGMGYTNDAMLGALSHAAFVQSSNTLTLYKYAGIFGRIGYTWDDKYVMELSARRDGSSRFGPGNRFGNFGSVALAWVATEEPWLKKVMSPAISFMKFNGNIGTVGQDGAADYQYLSQWGKPFGVLNYDGILPLSNMHAVNQDYHWQLTRELNLGMEIRFFKESQLRMEVYYYRKRVGNQLTNNPTPSFTGFPIVFGNWDATVQNEGLEMRLNASITRGKNFSWDAGINGSVNKNMLVTYPDIEHSSFYTQYLVGRPISTQYILNYLGVDPQTGLYQFQDYNKDGMLTRYNSEAPLKGTTDRQRIIDIAPRFTGGMNHSFVYKDFMLNLSFDFKIQKGTNAFASIPNPGDLGNIPEEIFNNRWQKPGDNARYAKFTTLGAYQGFARDASSLAYTDASYLRFNNISFQYKLPERFIQKIKMKYCSFNINAQNLFVITRYEGIDPEIQSFGGMPPARTITAGLTFTF